MTKFEDVKNVTIEEYFEGNQFAVNTFRDKYAFTKGDGSKETPAEVWRRVASGLAEMENTDDLKRKWASVWFSDLYEGYYRPGGSVTAGIGALNLLNEKTSMSNCTVVTFGGDSLDEIYKTGLKVAKNGSRRQGQGLDFSKLRPAGSKVGNAARFSDGVLSWMKWIDGFANHIGQHNRRLALLFSLRVDHPDIVDFIKCKDDINLVNNANISVVVDKKFIDAVENDLEWNMEFAIPEHNQTISKKMRARELMRIIAEHAWKTGEPGWQAIDLMEYWTNSPYITNKHTGDKYHIVGTNACLPGDTIIATRCGHKPIIDLIGTPTCVWDGERWVDLPNGFFETGRNVEGYKISLYDGSEFIATHNHKMVLDDGTKIEVKNLQPGHIIASAKYPILSEGIETKSAYFKGFLVGDGDVMKTQPRMRVASTKYACIPKLLASVQETCPSGIVVGEERGRSKRTGYYKNINGLQNVKELYSWGKEYKKYLPKEVLEWKSIHKAELVAGLFDSDGYCQVRGNQIMYQFSSISRQLVKDVQLLLKTLGIEAKTKKKEPKKDSIIYDHVVRPTTSYTLTVSNHNAFKLSKLCDFNRLKNHKMVPEVKRKNSIKRLTQYRAVTAVQSIGTIDRVYCCTVPTTHNFALSSGLLSGNCSERPLADNSTCILGSINLGILPNDFEEAKSVLTEKTANLTRLLDNVVEYELKNNLSPIPEQKETVSELREIGIGITDIQGYLLKHAAPYDSDKGIEITEELMKTICRTAYKTSEKLGAEKGNFLAFNEKEFKSSPFVKRLVSRCPELKLKTMRNCTLTSIAPVGSLNITFPIPNLSAGIEPVPGFYYWKRSRTSGQWKWYFCLPIAVRNYLNSLSTGVNNIRLDQETVEDPTGEIGINLLSKIKDYTGINLSESELFKPAHLIDPMKKIELMSRVAEWVDSSISTTYNLHENATIDTIQNIYMEAYRRGIKSVAVYRDKSRQGVIEFEPPPVVESRFSEKMEIIRPEKIEHRCAPKRPSKLPCDVHNVTVKGKKWTVIVGLFNEEPFEVFAGVNEEITIPSKLSHGFLVKREGRYDLDIPFGDDYLEFKNVSKLFINDEQSALTRLVSLNLRTGTHVQFVIEQLKKSSGSINDFSSAIARVLKKYERPIVKRLIKCPQCGSEELSYNGCTKCLKCGWERCE